MQSKNSMPPGRGVQVKCKGLQYTGGEMMGVPFDALVNQ